MVTQTFTMNQFLVYINELPLKVEKGTNEINMEMAKSLQRRIRFRAPSGSTGSLKKIELESKGKNIVLTGPEHWFFVNAGMAPDKFIPIELFEGHMGSPGSTAGKSVNIPNPKAWVYAGYHGGKGFVDNSIAALQQDIPTIIERGLNKAFSK
jgi:hypothetical protein